jgi:YVTN family beta-propeller protein
MNPDNSILHIGTFHGPKVKHLLFLVSVLSLLVSAGCGGGSTSTNGGGGDGPVAATVSSTIPVGTAPSAIALDSAANKVYVTDFGTQPTGSGTQFCSPTGADITVIDGATEIPTSTSVPFGFVTGQNNPIAVALNPLNHTIEVVTMEWDVNLTGKGCVHTIDRALSIDTSTFLINGFISLWWDRGDAGIDVNQTTGSIYVTHAQYVSGQIIGIVDDIGVTTISVGTRPAGVAVNTTTNKLYVANSGSNDVTVIDGTTNSVVATLTDPNAVAPLAVAVNSTTNTIYVANSQSNNLTVIDGATDSVTATITVGTSPSGVDVEPQTNFIYVTNAGNSQTADPGSITVIDGKTNTATKLMDSKAKNPVAVAANPVTNRIYVANSGSNNITVIDGAHD